MPEGDVFRRDKDSAPLCRCAYRLTEGPQDVVPLSRGRYVTGHGTITGTLEPVRMRASALLQQAGPELLLRLEDGNWLDIILYADGRFIGSGGIRGER